MRSSEGELGIVRGSEGYNSEGQMKNEVVRDSEG